MKCCLLLFLPILAELEIVIYSILVYVILFLFIGDHRDSRKSYNNRHHAIMESGRDDENTFKL